MSDVKKMSNEALAVRLEDAHRVLAQPTCDEIARRLGCVDGLVKALRATDPLLQSLAGILSGSFGEKEIAKQQRANSEALSALESK